MTALFNLRGTSNGDIIRVPATDAITITAAELDGANRGQRPDLLNTFGQVFKVAETGVMYVAYNGQLIVAPAGSPTSKLRAAVHGAIALNPLNQAAWAPAPNWAATTTYGIGACVRSTVAGSLDCLYMYCGTVSAAETYGGVSAASGGPSGTGYGLISDGTCVWQYIGKASTLTGRPLYSTVIPAAPTDIMDGYLAVINGGVLGTLGLTTQIHSASNPLFSISNGNVVSGSLLGKNTGTVAAPNRPTSALNSVIRFATNCNKWLGLVAQNAIYQNTTYFRGITVNGRWLSDQPGTPFTASQVNPGTFLLDLSSFPIGEKVIELYIKDSVIGPLNGIAVGADEYVYPYYAPTKLRMSVEGDSIGDMTYLSALDIRARMEVQLGMRLGIASVFNNCIGGTGFISNNSGNATTLVQRLDDVVRFNPDIHLVFGAHNDESYGQTARRAAFTTYFQEVRRRMPDTLVVVYGANLLAGESLTGTQLATEQDLAFCVAAMQDSGFLFIPCLTDTPVKISNGTNSRFFQAAGSPAAYNNGHPVFGYYINIVPQVVNAIRKWIG